ncbi:hypothetical protein CBOM_04486 [Ceraceosorus bombacis]|uniref:Uncharacterized protein n=1 Tax=Ceraceosorus bombacis TaxID=401625 RepID=A0A0P1BNV0_9BASI|nr:hypothetical protein CBOM_04486 [Ceraceosorus bombacis]
MVQVRPVSLPVRSAASHTTVVKAKPAMSQSYALTSLAIILDRSSSHAFKHLTRRFRRSALVFVSETIAAPLR